ncbi:MAG: patatin-like phospholipase family protein [Pseudolysinimonas sp.]
MTSSRSTALVLGGGGSAGNAWLIGVLAGLSAEGLDVADADLIVGTSAGSTAAAQLSGAPAGDLYRMILDTPVPTTPQSSPSGAGPSALDATNAIIAASSDPADLRRRAGSWAIGVDPTGERSPHWRATVARRLPSASWPQTRLWITAVDARTGEPVVFDRDSGVDLVDAVAASCAGGFAYDIDGNRYLDGGSRTNADNADLAAGYARVLILSPFGGRARIPVAWHQHLADQVAALRAGVSRVETLFPDAAALAAFGRNMMDLSTRPPSARAGFAQGSSAAGSLAGFWR